MIFKLQINNAHLRLCLLEELNIAKVFITLIEYFTFINCFRKLLEPDN